VAGRPPSPRRQRPLARRVVAWMRAGYPEGVPAQDYRALLGILQRSLTSSEIDNLVLELTTQAETGVSHLSREDIERRIAELLIGPALEEDVLRVSARLASAGWPLGTLYDEATATGTIDVVVGPDSDADGDGGGAEADTDTDTDTDTLGVGDSDETGSTPEHLDTATDTDSAPPIDTVDSTDSPADGAADPDRDRGPASPEGEAGLAGTAASDSSGDPTPPSADEPADPGADPSTGDAVDDTRAGLVGRVVGWLRSGYPLGLPEKDFVPLFALLRRRLSDEEVRQVGRRLTEEGVIPASRVDVGAAIAGVTTELPSDDDVERVSRYLADHGWPIEHPA